MVEQDWGVRVLVVVDERLVVQALRHAGHDVAIAPSCEEALAMTHTALYDAIVLKALSWSASLTACGRLRRSCPGTPILLIVPRDEPDHRIEGLDAGADDCISEPCAFPELLARLRALVRRANRADSWAPVEADICRRRIYRRSRVDPAPR